MQKTTAAIPEQLPDVLKKIKEFIELGKYVDTSHARKRSRQRSITLPAALHVLRTGRHEAKKTAFDPFYQSWKYAIRGVTPENLEARIIVAFDDDSDRMVIITIIKLKKS